MEGRRKPLLHRRSACAYSFRSHQRRPLRLLISQDASGRSDGYFAGGGPDYTGPVNTVGKAAMAVPPEGGNDCRSAPPNAPGHSISYQARLASAGIDTGSEPLRNDSAPQLPTATACRAANGVAPADPPPIKNRMKSSIINRSAPPWVPSRWGMRNTSLPSV